MPLDPGTRQLPGKEMTLEPPGNFGRSSCGEVWPPAAISLPPGDGHREITGRSYLERREAQACCLPVTRASEDSPSSHVLATHPASPGQCCPQTPCLRLTETCHFARRPRPRDAEKFVPIPPADNLAEPGFLSWGLRLQKPKFFLRHQAQDRIGMFFHEPIVWMVCAAWLIIVAQ